MAAPETNIDFCKNFAGFSSRKNSNFAKTDLVVVTMTVGNLLKICNKFEVYRVIGFWDIVLTNSKNIVLRKMRLKF